MKRKLHALIVGGTRGAGRVATRRFADAGHNVSVLARRPPAKPVPAGPIRVWSVDIVDADATRAALCDVAKRGPISALMLFQRFRGEGDQWQGEIDTSLTAVKNLIEMLVADFKLRDCSIVVITSIAARLVAPKNASLGYHVRRPASGKLSATTR